MSPNFAITRNLIGRILLILLLLGFVIVCLAPLMYLISISLSTFADSFDALLVPRHVVWQNYVKAWNTAKLSTAYKNSVIIVFSTMLINITAGALAAYAFARFGSLSKEVIFYIFLLCLFLPGVANIIPLFINLNKLGLLNTREGLIFPYAALGLPFTIIVLRGFFEAIPLELEEAAKIDGATSSQIFLRIIVPLAKPAFITVALFQFIGWWNELTYAVTFIKDEALLPIPPALLVLQGQYYVDYPVLFAALSLSMIPLIVLYLVFQKYFQKGLTFGALKG